MCGISGLWGSPSRSADELDRIGQAMSEALAHRGPDAAGCWCDPDQGVVFSHRRLSILDLSVEGAQPMLSPSGRYVLVYNGEIYNHIEIRTRLVEAGEAPLWRGHSDTEVLLAAIEAWGIEAALDATAGMYALALWDREGHSLFLARDRTGEKPLYFGHGADCLFFASELKAIHAVPGLDLELDPAALSAFLSVGYVPEGQSIYADVSKVSPGGILKFEVPADTGTRLQRTSFLEGIIETTAPQRKAASSFSAASREMERLLEDVIASQMISDVPVGSFLSGGIDSTVVTALMQSVSDRPVMTFSIGFKEADFDEAAHAAAVAEHLGTDHMAFRLSEADALALIPELSTIYDEPFADSSQIPTALLCREARRHVTVALTGDGGDEVFGGYNRHIFAPRAWQTASRLPRTVRRGMAPLAQLLHRLGGVKNPALKHAITRAGLPVGTLERLGRLGADLGECESLTDLYYALTLTGPGSELLREDLRPDASVRVDPEALGELEPAEWMMAMDSLTYLPGDILVKVDRAAMSTSLETRAPYLDRRVVAAAWELPLEARIAEGRGKRILRDILDRHVPRDLVERPKQGFAIPLDRWLRGELRPWAESLLSEDRIAETGILDPRAVRNLWATHLRGVRNEGSALWSVLMLMAWLERPSAKGQGVACRAAA
ncbi:asparagine synthase (glutamine-hydrolyzing) [Ovoidimarina sediminis]|uniref:asparagine synthase (glutamine-hydrolyzing) n=1 Tax=Ovoidimarina sediminis TaxID=3079856 RepID=UPI00291298E4|nr:asparagine synthase (glutamine-hydrolyzing) [Rhodophyticola sp. MJ-SS7]MDU8946140.1 asparagine synthase (glutamine-hydrolyzing) [Rhodophyticola sp. MJ-SS7]